MRKLINIGRLGSPLINFKARKPLVVPVKLKHVPWELVEAHECITPLEAFRRWKIARKAWRTRKMKDQLRLPL